VWVGHVACLRESTGGLLQTGRIYWVAKCICMAGIGGRVGNNENGCSPKACMFGIEIEEACA
jgi:hypothetical protein